MLYSRLVISPFTTSGLEPQSMFKGTQELCKKNVIIILLRSNK